MNYEQTAGGASCDYEPWILSRRSYLYTTPSWEKLGER